MLAPFFQLILSLPVEFLMNIMPGSLCCTVPEHVLFLSLSDSVQLLICIVFFFYLGGVRSPMWVQRALSRPSQDVGV